jgi:hypothetical protein
MAQTDPTGFKAFQKTLFDGGWYGSASRVIGGMAGQTETAIADAMTQYLKTVHAAGVPVTFKDYLAHAVAANVDNKKIPVPQVNLDDPEALRQAAMSAAQAALGHGLSEDQMNKFVAEFQGRQAQSQLSKAASVATPDASSAATAFAQGADPQGYANHQSQGYMNSLLNMFLPSADSRPTITPVASVTAA